LAQLFFNPTFLGTHGVDGILKEALKEHASQADLKTVDTLRNSLFGMFGMDLMTRNLVRFVPALAGPP
jgi:hypothetical protein